MKKAGIRFEEADYVRLYCEDTPGWKLLSPPAQMIYPLIRRKLNSAGVLELGGEDHNLVVTATLGWPEEWLDMVSRALDELLEKSWLVYSEIYDALIDPDFYESEHAKKTEAFRKRLARKERAERAALEGLEKAHEIREANRRAAGQGVRKRPEASGNRTQVENGDVRKRPEASGNGTRHQLRLLDHLSGESADAVLNADETSGNDRRRPETTGGVRKRPDPSTFSLLPSPSAFSPQAAAAGGGGERDQIQIPRSDDDRAALTDRSPESTRHDQENPASAAPQVFIPGNPAVAVPQVSAEAAAPHPGAPVVAEPQGSLRAAVPDVALAAAEQGDIAPVAVAPQGEPRGAPAAVQGFAREAPAAEQGFAYGAAALQPSAATAHALARKLEPDPRSAPASGFLAEAESLSRRLWSRRLRSNEIDVARRWFEEGFEIATVIAAIEKKCGMCEDDGQLRLHPPIDARGQEVANLAWFDGPVRDHRDAEARRRTENWTIPPPPEIPEACASEPSGEAAQFRAELVKLIAETWGRASPSRGEEETIQEWFDRGVELDFVFSFMRDPPDIGDEPARYLTPLRGRLLSAWRHVEGLQAPATAYELPATLDIPSRLAKIADALPNGLPDRKSFASRIMALEGDTEQIENVLEELEPEALRNLYGALTLEEQTDILQRANGAFAAMAHRIDADEHESVRRRIFRQLLREEFEMPVFSVL